MRLDRGTRIFTPSTTKVGERVWAPIYGSWYSGIVYLSFQPETHAHIIVCTDSGGWGEDVPYWQLRAYKPHLADKGKPDEPCPPTIGRPRGNPATKRVGILQNGGVRGRC